MKPLVSIIMGSTSDLPVMEKACKLLDELQVPFVLLHSKGRGLRLGQAFLDMQQNPPAITPAQ